MNNEITNKVNLVLIIIGLFLGLTIGLFLLLNKSEKNKANTYLGILVLLSLAYFLPGFQYRFDLLEQFPHTIGLTKLVGILIGPMTYLYVKACTQKGYKMLPIFWLHFIPFVIVVIIKTPFFLQSAQEKLGHFTNTVEQTILLENRAFFTLQSIHGLIYFFLSVQLIVKYKKHLENSTSYSDRSFYSWVLVFIGIHALPMLSMIIGFVILPFGSYTIQSVLFGFFLFSFAVFLAIMFKPELFHSFPHQMPFSESEENKTHKYDSSNLKEEQKQAYVKKLVQFVELNKPYLEPELTLTQLSEQTDIPAHYISQVINEKMNRNFMDFINGYRINDAKKKLADKNFDHFTIVAIAYEVGFNSKSAFYSVFKKKVGSTPSQYRKSALI